MALVVETGSGSATAESYVSVVDADTYHADRGNTAWAALATAAKEQALRKGTDFMIQSYRHRWKGTRVTTTQALDWPRADVQIDVGSYSVYSNFIANNIVPVEVMRACAEYALRASTAPLMADLTQAKASVTVGPISTSYDTSSPQTTRYKALDAMLAPYMLRGSNVVEAIRA